MSFDKTPKPFKPEALAAAQELKEMFGPSGVIIGSITQLDELRKKAKEALLVHMKAMKAIADDCEEKEKALKQSTKQRMTSAEELHNKIIAKLRELQPELNDIEFSLNLEKGTYTPISLRQKEEKTEEDEGDVITPSVKEAVADLIKKFQKR